MTRDELLTLCLDRPEAVEDFPFGDDVSVCKVAGKMFALVPVAGGSVSLKVEPGYGDHLRATYAGVRPGYHLNKRHWVTVDLDADVPDDLLVDLVDDSYALVVAGLPRADRSRVLAQRP